MSTAAGVPWPQTSAMREAPLAFGEREDVVVVAAGASGGLVVGGDIEVLDRRQLGGQQRPLDLGDGPQLGVHLLVGLVELALEHERVRGAAEEVGSPDHVGQLGGVEGIGHLPRHDDHVARDAVVVRGIATSERAPDRYSPAGSSAASSTSGRYAGSPA
jgi:hypothetical protein